MSEINNFELNVSQYMANNRMLLDNDHILAYSSGRFLENVNLLCLDTGKIFSLDYLFDKTCVSDKCHGSVWCQNICKINHHIGNFTTDCDHKRYYLEIVNKRYLCVICIHKENGKICFAVDHYDLHNELMHTKNINLNLLYCVNKCITHTNDNCQGDCVIKYIHPSGIIEQKLYGNMTAYQISETEYIFGTAISWQNPHKTEHNEYKKNRSVIVNIKTLDVRYFDNCDTYHNLSKNLVKKYVLMQESQTLIIYKVNTKKQITYPCDEIIHYMDETTISKVVIVYKHNDKFYLLTIDYQNEQINENKNENLIENKKVPNEIESKKEDVLSILCNENNTNNKENDNSFVNMFKTNQMLIERLMEKERELEKMNNDVSECVICYSETKKTKALLPCGHTNYCDECVTKKLVQNQCFICDKVVEKIIDIF